MPVKFFGQFLLEKNVITKEALLKAVALQDSTNLKFGELALSMGLITNAGITRSTTRSGRKICSSAICA